MRPPARATRRRPAGQQAVSGQRACRQACCRAACPHAGIAPRCLSRRPLATEAACRPAGPLFVGLLLCVACREHADKAGDVGIPDISVSIDGDRIGPGARPRQPEVDDLPIAKPAEAAFAHHSEPHRPVGRDGKSGQSHCSFADRKFLDRIADQPPDRIGAIFEEPDRAVGTDRDIRRNRSGAWQVKGFDHAVGADANDLVARLQARPGGAVWRDGDAVWSAARRVVEVADQLAVADLADAVAGPFGEPDRAVGANRKPPQPLHSAYRAGRGSLRLKPPRGRSSGPRCR